MRTASPAAPTRVRYLSRCLALQANVPVSPASRLGDEVSKGTELGRIVSPYTFEVLETVTAPFDPTLLVLVREPITEVDPGDFGFMVANGATAVPVERSFT